MPKKASGSKRERQYEHIKESYEERGQKGRAKEIAARTVNKERAQHGEAKSSRASKRGESPSARKSGSSGGRASASSGGSKTRDQLYQEARRKGIEGRSSMNKAQLERALSR